MWINFSWQIAKSSWQAKSNAKPLNPDYYLRLNCFYFFFANCLLPTANSYVCFANYQLIKFRQN
jgi:hypothetical protein